MTLIFSFITNKIFIKIVELCCICLDLYSTCACKFESRFSFSLPYRTLCERFSFLKILQLNTN